MQNNKGFTLVELLIVLVIIAIIAAIAIPSMVRARISGNEASAIGTLRTIDAAQWTFATACGGGGYAPDLASLAVAPNNSPSFIPADIASGTKHGYTFSINTAGQPQILPQAQTCNNAASSVSGFFVDARPISGQTGLRYFASNQSGLMKSSSTVITTATFLAAQDLQ